MLARLFHDEEGQDLIEYLVLGAFISITVLAGATVLGVEIDEWYDALGAWASDQTAKG